MRIRYYCPDCQKKSILNAIYTAEPRVCAWCGYPINPKHVKEQIRYQYNFLKVPLFFVGLAVLAYFSYYPLLFWNIFLFKNEKTHMWASLVVALGLTVLFLVALGLLLGFWYERNKHRNWCLGEQHQETEGSATTNTPDQM